MAGRHWLAPILADWKAGIQQEAAVQQKAALAALESTLEQEIAAVESQLRQDYTAAITRQVEAAKQALHDDMTQMEARLRDYVRSQVGSSAGDGRTPQVKGSGEQA